MDKAPGNVGASLAREIELSRAAHERARPLVQAIERRWPTRDRITGVYLDGSVRTGLHALFEVRFLIEADHVQPRLFGWDRDLTDQIDDAQEEMSAEGVKKLVDRVAEAVARLRPSVDVSRAGHSGADDGAREARRARLSTEAALAARAARERGDTPSPQMVDADRMLSLLHEKWHGTSIATVRESGDDREFSLRPYCSSEVAFNLERRLVGTSACVGTVTARMALWGPSVVERDDEPGVKDLIDRVDVWLVQTMPPPWVLERAVQAGAR